MGSRAEKLTFVNSAGHELSGRLELPEGKPRAFAIFAHCFTCSKDIAAASRISKALCACGIAVLRFDFTGLGNSDGDFANTNFTTNIEDLLSAAGHLRDHYEAPSILVGHSLGGSAVLGVASRIPEVRAVCSIGAPADPKHIEHLLVDDLETIQREGRARVSLGGRQFEITRQFIEDLEDKTFTQRIREMKAALLVYHSPIDNLVGIEEARKIYEAARHPKSFLSLHDADHLLTRKEDSEYVARTLSAWVSRYIPEPRSEAAIEAATGVEQGTVVVEEIGDGFAQRIVAGPHVLTADEPVSFGGTDTGPNPYDLLLAALGACTTMTLRIYARHKGWPLEQVSVKLTHDRIHARDCESCESEVGKVDRIIREITIRGPFDEEQRARILAIADKCPVHRTMMGEKEIVTREAE